MIELDVQLAADGVLVCCHDWDLERLASRTEVIEEEPSTVLIDIPLGVDRDLLPTFAEALAAIPEPMPLNVELKRRLAPPEGLVRTVLETLAGRSQVLLSSHDWDMLDRVRELAPDLPLAPISHPRTMQPTAPDEPGDLITAGAALGAFSLHCSRRLVTRGFIERATAEGSARTLSYTVNDPWEAECFFLDGLSGVFTDVPTIMLAHFRGAERGGDEYRRKPE